MLFFLKNVCNITYKDVVFFQNCVHLSNDRLVYSDKLSKTMCKLFLSTTFPHQEIRGNYGIFCSEYCKEQVNLGKHIKNSYLGNYSEIAWENQTIFSLKNA